MSMQISSPLSVCSGVGEGGEGVSWERDRPSGGTGTGTPRGNGTTTTMMGPSISVSSRPSSLSNASGVGVRAGVASPKRKLNKRPRVDSSEMDDGLEIGKGGKEVVRGAEDVEMKPSSPSGRKITTKAKDQKADVEKEAEEHMLLASCSSQRPL